jgi:tetratricopeptide (TPR) repeat protein
MLAFTGKPGEGLAAAEMAIRLNPSDCTAHLTKSECLGRLGKFVEALATLDQATGQSPLENAQIHLYRARFLLLMGRYDDFFHEIEQTSAIGPKHVLSRGRRWMLETVLVALERWEDLRVEALEGVTNEPGSLEQVTLAASALYALKRTDDALRLLEEAARRPWPTGAVFRSLADLLAFLGRGDDALRVLDEQSPHYPSEKVDFASSRNVVLRRVGRIDDARALAREMLASTPDLQHRAWWLAVAGEEVEVRTLLASAGPPQTPLDAFHLACVYALLGDADPAIHWLSSTLEQGFWPQLPDPDFERIRGDPRFAPLERRLLGH